MDEDCLILGSFSKNRKLDDTINVFDEESVSGSKRIVNPFKKKTSKHKSSNNSKSCFEKKKKTVRSTNVASTSTSTNYIATSASYSYSISETEIHHLQDGRTIASRGINTDPNPNILTCCACSSTDPSGTQVSDDFHNTLSHRKLSNEILELSNGLVLNELQNMGEAKMAQSLKPSVPDDYIDLKGKGKINTISYGEIELIVK